MADCPYARCIQERKHIRRELLRWTKNMVFVVGLERVAEELMGRRRWKQYQDTLYSGTRSSDNTNTPPSQLQQQQIQLQLQQLAQKGVRAQQVQQAKPGDSPSAALKAAVNLQQQQEKLGVATTNCTLSGGGGGGNSPRRADETDSAGTTTGGPENGRLAEGARENGAAQGCENGPLERHPKPEQQPAAPDAPAGQPIKREQLDDRLRLSPARDERTTDSAADNAIDTEGTKEVKEEVGVERVPQVTQGLLRVKKEEELQENPGLGVGGLVFPVRPTSTPLTNNNNIINSNNNNNNTNSNNNNGPSILETRSASTPPKKEALALCSPSLLTLGRRPSPPPEDWKPLDKCYFCLDGKLPHDEQPPLSPQSDSSNSSRSAESPMSVQVDPMAASVVAAALSGTYPTLLPQWCLPPREPSQMVAAVAAAAAAQHQHENPGAADQPLDLSAKPKNSQDNNISMLEQQKIPLRMSAAIDPKTIFNSTCYRAKPRVTGGVGAAGVPVTAGGGRRTYTEDELQAALRDIQSGKLGTRRAAVLYGIPRSTLRNKVYKLAMERERDATLANSALAEVAPAPAKPPSSADAATAAAARHPPPTTTNNNNNINTTNNTGTQNTIRQNANAIPQVDELNSWPFNRAKLEVDDKELSGAEEEKEVEKALLKPLLSLEDLVRFSSLEGSGGESLRTLLQRGQDSEAGEWPGFGQTNIGSYIQKMLAAAAPFKGLESQDYRIPEVMRRLMCEDKKLKETNVNGDQVQHLHQVSLQHRLSQSQTNQRVPMTNDDFNPAIEEEASDSNQGRPILKIPSYKPASSGGGTPGPSNGQGFGANASPNLLERASPAFSGTSSPTNSLVGKGMAVNFRDVIAKSISVKFQEGQTPGGIPGPGAGSGQSLIAEPNPYKRGRFTPPQQAQQGAGAQSQQTQQSKGSAQQQESKQQQQQQQQQQGKPATGGKGTRPKRGKYRNYDRDSLVEAVRAVQRGEMSVHRAGSYYGVPHSTLEYKVKERHLMRPRKRDQKQPDDKSKEPATVGTGLRTIVPATPDKKPLLKPQKPFGAPTTGSGAIPGPNGMKMPPFIDGMTHLPFAHPFNFWGPTPFMPAPFIPGGPNVPGILPEQYFASQRMRGLQEQQRNQAIVQRDGTSAEQPGTSNSRGTGQIKSPRDMAEGLYAEGAAAANGSFLDNLIRSSLESGMPRDRAGAEARSGQQQPENLGTGSKVLIDQLCRNSRRTPLPRPMQQDSSEDESPNYRRQAPERPPTVDLSPSPSERGAKLTDDGSDRGLASPPTPLSLLSLSRLSNSGRDDDATRDSRSSREREVHNGGGSEKPEDRQDSTSKKLNNFPDIQNVYAVSTDKKSACDSKLIVDQSSQKTQQLNKDLESGGLVVQLQRGYNNSNSNSAATGNGRSPASPNDDESPESLMRTATPSPQPTQMEESVEQ